MTYSAPAHVHHRPGPVHGRVRGTAQSGLWLIFARAVQGAGAAILAPTTLALLQTSFAEGPERTRAVSYYAAVAGVAATVGLVIGGMFAGWLS